MIFEMKLNDAHVKGIEEGREEGRAEEKFSIAKTMKTAGENLLKIVQFTGLTLQEVEAI